MLIESETGENINRFQLFLERWPFAEELFTMSLINYVIIFNLLFYRRRYAPLKPGNDIFGKEVPLIVPMASTRPTNMRNWYPHRLIAHSFRHTFELIYLNEKFFFCCYL